MLLLIHEQVKKRQMASFSSFLKNINLNQNSEMKQMKFLNALPDCEVKIHQMIKALQVKRRYGNVMYKLECEKIT
jgi:hypothetical protein